MSAEALGQKAQKYLCPIAVLYIRRVYHDQEYQPEAVLHDLYDEIDRKSESMLLADNPFNEEDTDEA